MQLFNSSVSSQFHVALLQLAQQADLSADSPVESETSDNKIISLIATISCPSNKTVPTDPGKCSAVVNNIDPVVSPVGAPIIYRIENGAIVTTGFGSASGLSFEKGVNTVKYSLQDDPGVFCTFTITVQDHEPPVLTCAPNLTVSCFKDVPQIAQPPIASDNCTQQTSILIQFVSETRSTASCPNRFVMTRTFKATDDAGNTSTCAQVITIHDEEPPYFLHAPPASTLNVSCPSDVPQVFPLTGRDNCIPDDELEDITAVFKEVKTEGSCANKYTLTRTWTLSDACGNTAVHTQVINVNDITAPEFNSTPAHMISVNCASEIPEAPQLTAEDNCYDPSAAPTVTLKEVISDQQCDNKFKLTRTWTATDACGNTSTVSQIVIVNDSQAPIFDGTPPSLITVSCTKDIPAPATQTAIDNCSDTPTITYSEIKTNVQCVNRYTLTRKWVASDACGNTASRTQTINVNDNEPPTITGISADPVVLWPPNHKMRDVTIDYTATDNCGVTSTLSVSSSEPVNGGSDGDQAPDWEVIDGHHVRLRAEKANNGQARHYTIKITISDGCNPPVDTSITVVVAHNITGPQSGNPFKVGSTVSFNGVFWDKPGNKHTAKWLLDGNTATNGTVTEPAGHQNGKVTGSYKFNSPGVYKLQMNVTDQKGITSYANTNNDLDAIVVIYDPNGGNTYGGGHFESPAGALRSDPAATGKASYGFAMNYFKNSTNPKGETQFEFKVGGFEFNALNFDYLVINKAMAQFKGTGKIIGGQSGIGFTMTVTDGEVDGTGIDKIRMKIYNKNSGTVIYDNQPGASDAALPVHAVGSNSTVVINNSNSENASQKAETETVIESEVKGLQVTAFPNPAFGDFAINVRGGTSEKVTIHVIDMYGRMIETRQVNPNSTTHFGNRYKMGTYVVKVTQGKEQEQIKVNWFR